jgi:hypothetical protein
MLLLGWTPQRTLTQSVHGTHARLELNVPYTPLTRVLHAHLELFPASVHRATPSYLSVSSHTQFLMC